VDIAEQNPDKEVVFLGAGFETTAPGTAIAIMVAQEKGLKNFSILSMLKSVEPALRALMSDKDFNVQGFLCPGHVATIIGERGFDFLPEEYQMPAVISGFEPEDILRSVERLLKQLEQHEPKLENTYERAVMPEGNPLAMATINKYFELRDDLWRGLGLIPKSGFGIREEYADYDAERKFGLSFPETEGNTACPEPLGSLGDQQDIAQPAGQQRGHQDPGEVPGGNDVPSGQQEQEPGLGHGALFGDILPAVVQMHSAAKDVQGNKQIGHKEILSFLCLFKHT
jgi:hypothetical protein